MSEHWRKALILLKQFGLVLIAIVIGYGILRFAVFSYTKHVLEEKTVGKFILAVPMSPSDRDWRDTADRGIFLAIEASELSASHWVKTKEIRETMPARITYFSSAAILLSNTVDNSRIYVRISHKASNAFSYWLYRPK